ncbi:hypothetical protein Ari01nite_84710 [Paractinoplanes rishiriensis]|uniref:Uncharacterized protein n=1 Tax=Paractinoplanes rishiriensis TaxID=1050105 RepID=A0A919KCE8_9ACTN|nr:hypothetical protein Ari01nite_84710 [Actinoplanes rishiriensis]
MSGFALLPADRCILPLRGIAAHRDVTLGSFHDRSTAEAGAVRQQEKILLGLMHAPDRAGTFTVGR